MCGICGEYRFDRQPASLTAIEQMMGRLERRGPDQSGCFAEGALALGHRRLSIIDLSWHGHQPMVERHHGLSLVFNGTIYNYRELRAELIRLGQPFFSTSDTEVILRGWAEWGKGCVERLHGMFAFAIHDARSDQLFLVRDRIGIKPLYWSMDNHRLRFASNTQALIAAGGIGREIDPVALHYQFTLHGVVPAPHTILQGIRKLAPATIATIERSGAMREERYWQLEARRPAAGITPISEDEWLEMTRHSLAAAIERRLTAADVPVGVLLSGGLDSSLIVALMAEGGRDDIETFSVGFEDQPEEKGSEFEYSDLVVSRFGTRHHQFRIANSEVLKRLPEAVAAMAEPMFAQDAIAFYLLAEQVSSQVKVVLSGQGADELFGGYFWYPLMESAQGTPLERFAGHYFDRDHQEWLSMVDRRFHGDDHTSRWIGERLVEPGADSFLDQVLRLDVTALVVDDPVKRVDTMTMAWGLEARVPFLDHQLIELAMQMPPALRLREGGKYPLKAIARGRLPDPVIDRPKGYFPVPALKYVRGPFLNWMRELLLDDACQRRGLYQRTYLERILANPEGELTRIRGSKLWHMALLEFWLQSQVD
jgi:asparagine synthase (glutamine-hydrolysing)